MTTKQIPATPLPWKASGGCLNPHLPMSLDADAHRIDAAYIAHAANAYPRLIDALHHVRELAQENAKGQDGYEIIAEWTDSLLRELGE